MKKEYNLKKLKVKRRGILPALQKEGGKIRITITLDKDLVDYFKAEAKQAGALPYQTQINQALRQYSGKQRGTSGYEEIKTELLNDPDFMNELAKKVNQKRATK